MENLPLVSVIIPMYNASGYIAETLLSLKAQTYTNYEVILVDNASTDNGVAVVNTLSKEFENFTLIMSEVNSGGPAKPRNIGIENAQGEYIAFLDSDDLWEKDKLSCQIDCMLRGDLNFTCTSSIIIDENSDTISRSRDFFQSKKNRIYGVKSLLFRNTILTSSVVVRRDILGVHRFNEDKAITTCEDYLLWLNLLHCDLCSFVHLHTKLVRYRVVSSSLGNAAGLLMFATKSLLASSDFLVRNKLQKLLIITVVAHFLRAVKLILIRAY